MKLQMDGNSNECWDIWNNRSIKEALPSEAGLGNGSLCCHGNDQSHFCGVEKSSEANFSTEVVKCTNRYSSLLVTFPSGGSPNGGSEKEASGKKKRRKTFCCGNPTKSALPHFSCFYTQTNCRENTVAAAVNSSLNISYISK